MHGAAGGWSHRVETEADGTARLDIVDEDGVTWPVARAITPGQAEKLVAKIAEASRRERKPVKVVIRDPHFMAATVLTVKRQPI
jgi:hypothetical protein